MVFYKLLSRNPKKRLSGYKYFALPLLLLLFVFMQTGDLYATDNTEESSLQESIKNIDLSVLEEFKSNIDRETSIGTEGTSVKEWLADFVGGEWKFDPREMGTTLIKLLFQEVVANTGLLAKLLVLSVLAALLVSLQGAFSSEVSKIAYLSCYLAISALAVGSFKLVLSIGQQTIDNMVAFMVGMLPQMLVLTAGLGNVNASVMLFPILMTTATAFANAIKNVVFPLILLSAVLGILNQISESIKVQRLGKLFGQLAQISLGFFLTVFVGVVTLRALYAAVLDKVALRTTKFITDAAIPIVGKLLSETVEVAAGYVVMLKQALGVLGILIVLGIILLPLIKIAALALIYKASAAMAEPLGDPRTAAILESMSSHLFLMLAAVASVALMFFIMIAIVAGMSNGWSMLH